MAEDNDKDKKKKQEIYGAATYHGGINRDVPPPHMPEGDYIFALNALANSREGDTGVLSNENSIAMVASLPPGYLPVGSVYMTQGETAVFLAATGDDNVSEIGIFKDTGEYTTIVNDKDSSKATRLDFNIASPISAVFRMRRGCDRTVYWVDRDRNVPRHFIFDKATIFKDKGGKWHKGLFAIQKSYSKIPSLNNIKVLDSEGHLLPGSYNIGIQLVDRDYNRTEWITTSRTINIYHASMSIPFRDISGSINGSAEPVNFGNTSKAISVDIGDLDDTYPYYRLCLISATSNNGQITKIEVTKDIDSKIRNYVFTGSNTIATITEGELMQEGNRYDRAHSIAQLDNRLIMGGVKREDINWGRLQKYASRINADCILKRVQLDDVKDPGNPKNPTVRIGNTGYMPGEVYSFGIVYLFEDGVKSPVYHIPGKSDEVPENTVFKPYQDKTFGMRHYNTVAGSYYSSPKGFDFWGLDGSGKKLENRPIRHHRFPSRAAVGTNLFNVDKGTDIKHDKHALVLKMTGNMKKAGPIFSIKVAYNIDGQQMQFENSVIPAKVTSQQGGDSEQAEVAITEVFKSEYANTSNFSDIKIYVSNSSNAYDDGVAIAVNGTIQKEISEVGTMHMNLTTEKVTDTYHNRSVWTNIFGIQFSNIDLPTLADTNGHKVIGYYIVRNERTDNEKTILDTGVLTPIIFNGNYASSGMMYYKPYNEPRDGGDPLLMRYPGCGGNHAGEWCYGLLHPEFLFNGKKYSNVDAIEQVGSFVHDNSIVKEEGKGRGGRYSYLNYDDVAGDGDSASTLPKGSSDYDKGNDDAYEPGAPYTKGWDGMSFSLTIRDTQTLYNNRNDFNILGKDIKRWFYLDALESQQFTAPDIQLYNLCTTGKWIVFDCYKKTSIFHKQTDTLPYVQLKKANATPYQNYDVLPYYRDTPNVLTFSKDSDNTTAVYGGDVWVTPLRFTSMLYYQTFLAKRLKNKAKLFLLIAGAVLGAILGGVLIGLSFGAAAPAVLLAAGLTAAGVSALLTASGIRLSKLKEIFDAEYKKGLEKTLIDDYFGNMMCFGYGQAGYFGYNPRGGQSLDWGQDGTSDDTIMWGADCVTDLWFESTVNMGLRNGFFNHNEPTFAAAPGDLEYRNRQPLETFGINKDISWRNSNERRNAQSALEHYLINCILVNNSNRNAGKLYLGSPLGTYYNINADYTRSNDGKPLFALPKTYDVLSLCQNSFPHRIVWSNQSFQEQYSDNYTQFLPNNYIDIDGSTGYIREIIIFNNNLHVFTEECLWLLPNERQERITNDIVTYIGSGEFLSVPARKIIDSNTGMSAGCIHKYSVVKTPQGLFYVSARDNKIYHFNGQQLTAISDKGIMLWSKENIIIQQDLTYYHANKKEYPYIDNPNNPIGSGYITAYDTHNNRVLFTKKDRTMEGGEQLKDFLITSDGVQSYIFIGYNATIALQESLGWEYVGIDGGKRMKFRKDVPKAVPMAVTTTKMCKVKKTKKVWEDAFKNIDYLQVYYYFNLDDLDTRSWITYPKMIGGNKIMEHPVGWNSLAVTTTPYYQWSGDNQGIGAESFVINIKNMLHDDPTLDHIEFWVGGWWYQSHPGGKASIKLTTFNGGTLRRVDQVRDPGPPEVKDFIFINEGGNPSIEVPLDPIEITNDHRGKSVSYDDQNRELSGEEEMKKVTSFGKFKLDLREGKLYKDDKPLSQSVTTLVEKTVEYEAEEPCSTTKTIQTQKLVTEFKYIDAVPYNRNVVDFSWTLSYNLMSQRWVSFHSYFPNMYITTPNSLYSIGRAGGGIYEHNRPHTYQQYYGRNAPHIVEFVVRPNMMGVSVWDTIQLTTDAMRYANGGYYDARLITFNRAIIYNSRQCSGMLELKVKDSGVQSYIAAVGGSEAPNISVIDRREKVWNINEFRDIRVDYESPIFFENIGSRQGQYYIDKVLNEDSLDINKDWHQLERFRDRYLVIRLIFDRYSDVKLLTRFTLTHNTL